MAGSCEHGSEQSNAVRGMEYLDKLEEFLTHEEILNSIEFFTNHALYIPPLRDTGAPVLWKRGCVIVC
jgi:hypothetical protein